MRPDHRFMRKKYVKRTFIVRRNMFFSKKKVKTASQSIGFSYTSWKLKTALGPEFYLWSALQSFCITFFDNVSFELQIKTPPQRSLIL